MKLLWNFWVGFCENPLISSCIASHVHYHYIFMHLDVCYICQTGCVLVGLNWVEPMVILLLHITCSCIFMHTSFPFNIFVYIWITLGLFWLSSLSLSFSVYVSLLLWHPNLNLFHPGTLFAPGHPVDTTPFSVRFCDEKVKSDFFENFSRWGIHFKCHVILSNFSDTDLPIVIYSIG